TAWAPLCDNIVTIRTLLSWLSLGLRQRAQGDHEGGTAPRLTPYGHVALVRAGQLAHQPQTDPEPPRAIRSSPDVTPEDPLPIPDGDPDPVVADAHAQRGRSPVDDHVDGPPLAELEGVREQVLDDLLDGALVPPVDQILGADLHRDGRRQ